MRCIDNRLVFGIKQQIWQINTRYSISCAYIADLCGHTIRHRVRVRSHKQRDSNRELR